MLGIPIKVLEIDAEINPLPYAFSYIEWNDHVRVCVPCAHVDQLATAGQSFNPMDLCEGGAILQMTVQRRMNQQHEISLQN